MHVGTDDSPGPRMSSSLHSVTLPRFDKGIVDAIIDKWQKLHFDYHNKKQLVEQLILEFY